MAKIEPLEAYKAQQRRLALLALLADQPKATTDCVEDERMASLVEGSLSPQETEQCMAHLAQCDRCSGLWVQLDQEWQRQDRQEQRDKRRKLQKKPRPFTLIGSLLAAAASVAVFVTITTRVDRKAAHLPPPPAERQQERMAPLSAPAPAEQGAVQKSAPLASGAPSQEMAAVADNTVAAPAPAAPQADAAVNEQQGDAFTKKKETAISPATTADQSLLTAQVMAVAEKEASAAPEPVPEPPEPLARAAKPAAAPPAGGSTAPLSLATWQEQLRHDCTRPPMPEQLTALAVQGRQLLASTSLDEAGQQRVRLLLQPLEGQQEVEARCKAILERLGPAPQSP